MKALKVNAKIALNNGLSTAAGAIVVIAEGYANIAAVKDDLIPCQVITNVYASLTAYNDGKSKIDQIADFNPSFLGLQLSVQGYETLPTQDLLIGVAQEALEVIYPGKIEVIEI
jgi:hypothetical protein